MDLCKYEVYEIQRKDISNNIYYFLSLKYFYKKTLIPELFNLNMRE
jgi:hypothetical protein